MRETRLTFPQAIGNKLPHIALSASLATTGVVGVTGCSESSSWGNKDIPSPAHGQFGRGLHEQGYPVADNCDRSGDRSAGHCPIYWDPVTKKYTAFMLVNGCTVEAQHVGDKKDFVIYGVGSVIGIKPEMLTNDTMKPKDKITDTKNLPFDALKKAITITQVDGRFGPCKDKEAKIR